MKQHKATWGDRDVFVSVVEDSDGGTGTHYVNTADGPVAVRTGDFVLHGVSKAPAGYHSQTIDKVVRKDKNGKPRDTRLTLGDPVEPEDTEDELEFEDEDDEFEADDEPTQPANKRTTTAKATTPAKTTTPASGSK